MSTTMRVANATATLKPYLIMALFFTLMVIIFLWNSSLRVISLSELEFTTIDNKGAYTKICFLNTVDRRQYIKNDSTVSMIYYVTPTYPRAEQIPELTRLSHTLMHVPRIHWIVADDQIHCDSIVNDVLERSRLPYTHISSPRPKKFRETQIPRGVANRLAALDWLRENKAKGVLYFGDDDNTIDLQLFNEIRTTKKVSMFPVGLIGQFGVSAPVVKNGKVVGFFDSWPAKRIFPVDMAGFAVNLQFLNPTATMPFIAGHEEDRFLISTGIKMDDIEPLAANCSQVLVWHTRASKFKTSVVQVDLNKISDSQDYEAFSSLLRQTSQLNMATFKSNRGVKPFINRDRKTYKTWIDFY